MNVDVVVLLRCRYRTWQLLQSLSNIWNVFFNSGLTYKVYCMPDRPTPEVSEILHGHQDELRIVNINDGETGHRWAKMGMIGLNMGLDVMDKDGVVPRWLYFHDDDEILPPMCGEELEKCLNDKGTLAWTATSLFVWDNIDTANINIFHHSPIFGRYRKGDRFPEDGRSVQVTGPIHKRILRNSYRKKTLPFYIRDLSAMAEKDRAEQIERFKQSGKDDDYTRPFSQPPCLMSVGDIEREWDPVDFFYFQVKRGKYANGNESHEHPGVGRFGQ